jgi:lathosterol oxidase
MDVFLDVLDTIFFDRLYAMVLPAPSPVGDAVRESQKLYNQNIGRYIPLAPSPYVDASIWKRDDIVRQTTSLFLIAW